ncbi:hypothetical protein FEM48_Zijuj02G0098300 [Ziziphus jujuba var. spinosa]|uniref:ArsA/GET3 Anion-transporting ATPase-like domain-containing protein n=1 Tax=Ziziphus jujuba var. spinosa TaxID=714518 RepID=A0A978VV21_ZIZJJ|nr:hypothetical protein FEM48_Zijuj02G0098300 [Ziziphus jujuba var. spinosa]
MAMAGVVLWKCKTQFDKASLLHITRGFTSLTSPISTKLFATPFQGRLVVDNAEATAGFDEIVAGTQRKYYMLGGKGGMRKTSYASSLAFKFANHGHPTLIVSTDPAYSLSDSFAQDLARRRLIRVEGVDSPLFALEMNLEKAREEFHCATKKYGSNGFKELMRSMGLGKLGDQVMQFLQSEEYSMFSRIVFDTAPTGHTLRLLSLPDFMDASIGKMMKPDKLEQLKERMGKVRDLFHNSDTTEFVIVTIPIHPSKVMAISESSRLRTSLRKENVTVQRLVINQVLPPSVSDCKFCVMRRKDQMRALEMIQNDIELGCLRQI